MRRRSRWPSAAPLAALPAVALMALATLLAGCGSAGVRMTTLGARTEAGMRYPPVAIGPGRCPPRQPRGAPVSRARAARHELTPPGISSIELCRYGPISPRVSRLQARRTLRSPAAINALRRILDALPAPPSGGVHCASDDGAGIWLGLLYRSRPEVIVSVQLQGCRDVSNGSIVVTASGYGEPHDRPPPLKEQLLRLIPLHPREPAAR